MTARRLLHMETTMVPECWYAARLVVADDGEPDRIDLFRLDRALDGIVETLIGMTQEAAS